MAKKFSLEAVLSLTDKMTTQIGGIQKKMGIFSKGLSKTFKQNTFAEDFQRMGDASGRFLRNTAIGAAAATAGVAVLGKAFIDAGAEAQGYKTVLTTMLGTQEAANKRFDEYSRLAAVTPFELTDIVELGNGLQALGRYSEDNVKLLGDLAAASGKPIDQVRGAFAKLVSGQKGEAVNMFRDLLVTTADWSAATGKGIKKNGEMIASTEEMIAALPTIMKKKGFVGMMDNMSKTIRGQTSNMADSITRFKMQIGEQLLGGYGGVISAITEKITEFSDAFGNKASPAIQKLNDKMGQFAAWIKTLDIGKIIDDVFRFVEGAIKLAKFLAPLAPYILTIAAALKVASIAMGIYNVVAAANPTTWIILGIIAAVAALIMIIKLIVDNWEAVKAAGAAAFEFLKEGIIGVGATILDFLLTPLRFVLSLVAKIPGMADKLKPVTDVLDSIHERSLFGQAGQAATYASPATRGSESRTYAESRTVNEVFVRPDKGAAISPTRGGAPSRALNYGLEQ